jgi:hypothetical protein
VAVEDIDEFDQVVATWIHESEAWGSLRVACKTKAMGNMPSQ